MTIQAGLQSAPTWPGQPATCQDVKALLSHSMRTMSESGTMGAVQRQYLVSRLTSYITGGQQSRLMAGKLLLTVLSPEGRALAQANRTLLVKLPAACPAGIPPTDWFVLNLVHDVVSNRLPCADLFEPRGLSDSQAGPASQGALQAPNPGAGEPADPCSTGPVPALPAAEVMYAAPPAALQCPLSGNLLVNPQLCSLNGRSYSELSFKAHIERTGCYPHSTQPVERDDENKLRHVQHNAMLDAACEDWRASTGDAPWAKLRETFTCMITQDFIENPVTCVDTQTYERESITQQIRLCGTSPNNRMPLDLTTAFVDNHALRALHALVMANSQEPEEEPFEYVPPANALAALSLTEVAVRNMATYRNAVADAQAMREQGNWTAVRDNAEIVTQSTGSGPFFATLLLKARALAARACLDLGETTAALRHAVTDYNLVAPGVVNLPSQEVEALSAEFTAVAEAALARLGAQDVATEAEGEALVAAVQSAQVAFPIAYASARAGIDARIALVEVRQGLERYLKIGNYADCAAFGAALKKYLARAPLTGELAERVAEAISEYISWEHQTQYYFSDLVALIDAGANVLGHAARRLVHDEACLETLRAALSEGGRVQRSLRDIVKGLSWVSADHPGRAAVVQDMYRRAKAEVAAAISNHKWRKATTVMEWSELQSQFTEKERQVARDAAELGIGALDVRVVLEKFKAYSPTGGSTAKNEIRSKFANWCLREWQDRKSVYYGPEPNPQRYVDLACRVVQVAMDRSMGDELSRQVGYQSMVRHARREANERSSSPAAKAQLILAEALIGKPEDILGAIDEAEGHAPDHADVRTLVAKTRKPLLKWFIDEQLPADEYRQSATICHEIMSKTGTGAWPSDAKEKFLAALGGAPKADPHAVQREAMLRDFLRCHPDDSIALEILMRALSSQAGLREDKKLDAMATFARIKGIPVERVKWDSSNKQPKKKFL